MLQKSVENANLDRIKKKVALEEKEWYNYMPPAPKFIAEQPKKKKSAWGLLLALRM